MREYQCLRCGYKTRKKDDLRKHYNRKRPCKILLENITQKECLKLLENDQNYYRKVEPIKTSVKKQEPEIKCEIGMLKEQNKILTETIVTLQTQVTELLSKIGNNNTTTNNIDNSTTNNITIQINDYKNTNYKIVSREDFMKCIDNRGNIDFPKLLETVHFNEKYPENHNLKIDNAKLLKVMIKENGEFEEMGRGVGAVKELIDNKIDDFTSEETIPDQIKNKVIDLDTAIYSGNKDVEKDVVNKVKSKLINKRKLVNKTNGIKC